MEDIKKETVKEETKAGLEVVDGPGTKGKIPEGAYVFTLIKHFTYEDRTYGRFIFDFEKLTGNDLIDIENEMAAMGEAVLVPETSTSFLSRIAARAAGVGSDVITALPVGEFLRVKNIAQNFLTGVGSRRRTL